MGLQEVRHMETDTGRVIELVKSVRLLFMDHERASGITVKGTAALSGPSDILSSNGRIGILLEDELLPL